MIPFQLLLSGFFLLPLLHPVKSTALTTAIAANEKLCFYADVDKEFDKIGVRLFIQVFVPLDVDTPLLQFYFAVGVYSLHYSHFLS